MGPADCAAATLDAPPMAGPTVRHLRQVLLWPLRLMPMERVAGHARRTPWRELIDEYAGGTGRFKERHDNEFVTFLP